MKKAWIPDHFEYVRRRDWEAEAPLKQIPPNSLPCEHVVYYHSLDMPRCESEEECVATVQAMQMKHMKEGHPDILYNFLIGGDGRLYEGRGFRVQSDPSLSFPELLGNRLDIAYIGNYGPFEKHPIDWKIFSRSVNRYLNDKEAFEHDGKALCDCGKCEWWV